MSGGQQQRCACARALINRPDLIFADEPTGNLDSNSRGEMLAFLRRSVTEFGQSIVMVTHDPHGAAYADRVVFLADGNMVDELTSRPPTWCWSGSGRWGPDMWRVTIKGLLAHKLRLALTALAIVLGVTFISGTFVLTDTLHNTFKTLFSNIYQNIDFQVRGVAQFGSGGGRRAIPCPSRSSRRCGGARCRGRPARSRATRSTSPRRARPSRPVVRPPWGSPSIRTSRSPARLDPGGLPTTPNDVVMDLGTAEKYHFRVGQRVRILLAGRRGPSPSPARALRHRRQSGRRDPRRLRPPDGPGCPAGGGGVRHGQRRDDPGADKAAVQRDIARVLLPATKWSPVRR